MATIQASVSDNKSHVVDLSDDGVCDGGERRRRREDPVERRRRCSGDEIVGEPSDKERRSPPSSSSEEGSVDLDSEVKGHFGKLEIRDCRICQVSLDLTNHESGTPMELGCSCKNDLAVAHKHCAEAWFKIKGNKTCEICGSTARNVAGANEAELVEQWNEASEATTTVPAMHLVETRNFWQGHRFLNFLLACMVFAFVISWLFHFNVPS